MSLHEIERLQQILAQLVKKRAAHLRRIEELYQPPIDKLTRGKVRILGLQRQRLDREIHMHEREIERLREQRDDV